MLVLLAVAAGCVDAVSYLGLGEVLTAAMTGNTVLLGLAIGQAEVPAALRSCAALVGFVFGAIVAAAISERGAKDAIWPRAVTAALALELAVLVALAFGWHLAGDEADATAHYLYTLIGAAGIAMGIQSVTVRRLGVAGVATTYVTGTLTSSAVRLVGWLRASGSPAPRPADSDSDRSDRAAKPRGPGYLAIVWLAYGAGAVAAGAVKLRWSVVAFTPVSADTAMALRWPSVALFLPILIVAIVVTTAAIRYRHSSDR